MADNAYAGCSLNGNEECGPFLAKRSSELIEFSDLNENVEYHFKTLKINLSDTSHSLASIRTEKGLTLDRVKIKEESIPDNAKIYPKHRYYNGVYYYIRGQCAHPKREELRTESVSRTKKISCRTASIPLVEKIRSKLDVHFPVGGKLCTTCRKASEKVDGVDDPDTFTNGDQEDEDVNYQSTSTISDVNSSIKEI